jgi:signal transduction histidine kinase
MILALLVIHAVLLPAVYFGALTIVKNGQEEAFVDHTRILARIIADNFEADEMLGPEASVTTHLDSMVLGGRGSYAVLETDEKTYASSLMSQDDVELFKEDFHFGENDDDIYYLSLPLMIEQPGAVLKLGFDERPTLNQIENVRGTLFTILLAYFFVSILLVALFGLWLARPLQRLRDSSRKVASGDYSRKLSVTSNIYEISELTRDLETMRSNIVGVNARLRKESAERAAAETEQKQLEARLRHSQRLDSIGTLAGGIAHEFNNIMLPVILYAELALEDLAPDDPARNNLKKILDLSSRAKGLSRQILTFGKPSSDAEMLYLDIRPVIEEAMSMVRALIPASVDIRTDFDDNTGEVYCDPSQIQQLVVNLCSNAFRSLAKGGGYIHIRLGRGAISEELATQRPRLASGEFVCLSVSDTGQGMDQATIERIFEPFFTTREVGEGTGLGLSVVHGIVAKHKGEIVVSSEVGKGSSFDVFLPRVEDETE